MQGRFLYKGGPQAGQQSAPHMHVLVCICSNVRQFNHIPFTRVVRAGYVQTVKLSPGELSLAVFCQPKPLACMLRYIEMTQFPGLSIRFACCWQSGGQLDTCHRIPGGGVGTRPRYPRGVGGVQYAPPKSMVQRLTEPTTDVAWTWALLGHRSTMGKNYLCSVRMGRLSRYS